MEYCTSNCCIEIKFRFIVLGPNHNEWHKFHLKIIVRTMGMKIGIFNIVAYGRKQNKCGIFTSDAHIEVKFDLYASRVKP